MSSGQRALPSRWCGRTRAVPRTRRSARQSELSERPDHPDANPASPDRKSVLARAVRAVRFLAALKLFSVNHLQLHTTPRISLTGAQGRSNGCPGWVSRVLAHCSLGAHVGRAGAPVRSALCRRLPAWPSAPACSTREAGRSPARVSPSPCRRINTRSSTCSYCKLGSCYRRTHSSTPGGATSPWGITASRNWWVSSVVGSTKNDLNRYIKTVPRHGYQFVAAVTPVHHPEGEQDLELLAGAASGCGRPRTTWRADSRGCRQSPTKVHRPSGPSVMLSVA